MQYVTNIKKQRGFMLVEINDEPSLRIPISLFRERTLQVGDPYDAQTYEAWLTQREFPHALERAVSFLATRARTKKELTLCLQRCGYTPQAIDHVLERLKNEGYVNDAQFADQWMLVRTGRGIGKRRLAQELMQKGVDRETIDAALENIDEDDMLDAAVTHAKKLLNRTRGKDDYDIRRKVIAGLQRRGYDYAIAKEALARANAPLDEDEYGAWDE